jgi:hypothetical protein
MGSFGKNLISGSKHILGAEQRCLFLLSEKFGLRFDTITFDYSGFLASCPKGLGARSECASSESGAKNRTASIGLIRFELLWRSHFENGGTLLVSQSFHQPG